MATRSTIAILHLDGSITQVYCHNDGYISNNGVLLYEHYRSTQKVKELLSFSHMSSLGANIAPPEGVEHSFDKRAPDTCVFYQRDRKEERVEAHEFKDFEDYATKAQFEVSDYVLQEKNATWYLFNQNTHKLQPLIGFLKKEAKNNSRVLDVLERVRVIENIEQEKNKLDKAVATAKLTTLRNTIKV